MILALLSTVVLHFSGQATQAGHVDTIPLDTAQQSVTIHVDHVVHASIVATSDVPFWQVNASTLASCKLGRLAPVERPAFFTLAMGIPGTLSAHLDTPTSQTLTLSPVPASIDIVTKGSTTASGSNFIATCITTFDDDVTITYGP